MQFYTKSVAISFPTLPPSFGRNIGTSFLYCLYSGNAFSKSCSSNLAPMNIYPVHKTANNKCATVMVGAGAAAIPAAEQKSTAAPGSDEKRASGKAEDRDPAAVRRPVQTAAPAAPTQRDAGRSANGHHPVAKTPAPADSGRQRSPATRSGEPTDMHGRELPNSEVTSKEVKRRPEAQPSSPASRQEND